MKWLRPDHQRLNFRYAAAKLTIAFAIGSLDWMSSIYSRNFIDRLKGKTEVTTLTRFDIRF